MINEVINPKKIPIKRHVIMLALPDSDLADAAAEVTRTRSELSLYERPEDGTAAVEVEE